jgi:transposase-like protein
VEQIVAVLKQVELGMVVADACRKMGISEQTLHRWNKQYGSLRRACHLVQVSRNTPYYERRKGPRPELRRRKRKLANTQVR